MAEAVCLFASAGLRKGEAVLLIMTEHTAGQFWNVSNVAASMWKA